MNILQHTLLGFIRAYRLLVSPLLAWISTPFGFGCRFTPTCSQYAATAIARHGALHGSWLALLRICRCHPWGGSGHDPVPEAVSAGRTGVNPPTGFHVSVSEQIAVPAGENPRLPR